MLFSSMVFIWIFLPIVLFGNILAQKWGGNKAANVFLFAASLFFYAWGEPIYVFLMIISITVNWGFGRIIEATQNPKAVLAIDIVINLGLLGYFKYAGMLISTINTLLGTEFNVPQIPLPIGISFFTFQALSYVIDVYRKETESQRNWFNVALYVSFFPQLIAGPIVKYTDINDQILNRKVCLEETALGIRRFVYGFSKKILIANSMGLCADQLYSVNMNQMTSLMAWIASIAYTLQIYYDFSGYSDMAIGLGKIFGFTFKENFEYPYISHSISEFWRRWHISLGTWFRNYVYIPLGGNRNGTVRTNLNLLIVFFLTGIWHGASWTFVFWGIYHGLFCIAERLWLAKSLNRHVILSWMYCILVVHIGWVFFRLDDFGKSFAIVKRMFIPWRYKTSHFNLLEFMSIKQCIIILLGILGAGVFHKLLVRTGIEKKLKFTFVEIGYCSLILLLSIMSLASSTYNPFIYFRF